MLVYKGIFAQPSITQSSAKADEAASAVLCVQQSYCDYYTIIYFGVNSFSIS